ncbi:hypothetical protein N8261_04480 [Flavobacteriaceae bacterium]|nr:hypothetical protein [Flavobacteriaceae bacterium]
MNAGKKARYQQSISNQTSIFGIMGGLAPRIGKTDVAVYRHILIKGGKGLPEVNGLSPTKQRDYMMRKNLLSKNPLGSGGVGKGNLLYSGSKTGSAPQGGPW